MTPSQDLDFDLEAHVRWPFRVLAGLVGLVSALTCAALAYDAVRDPHELARTVTEWALIPVVWLFLAMLAYVFLGIALAGSGAFLDPVLRRAGSLLEPRNTPLRPGGLESGLGSSNCMRCGSYCGPETEAFIAPMAAALCPRCVHHIHAAATAGDLRSVDGLSYPDAVAPQVVCSFCKRPGMPGLLAWPAGTICRGCLELAATHQKRK